MMKRLISKVKQVHKFTYLVFFILLASSIFSSVFPFFEIYSHIPLAQNEGWNAYQIDRVINPALGPLYPDPENGLIFNNYPPLSFYIVGYISKYIIHDVMVAGRITNFLFLFLSCLMCGFITRLLGAKPIGIILSFFIPFIYTAEYFEWWFMTNDPQWISIFFVLISLFLALSCLKNKKYGNYFVIFWAAFFSVIAGTAKHNEFSIPLVITIILFMNDKKLFYAWCISGVFLATSVSLYLYSVFGKDIISDVFFHPRVMSIAIIKKAQSFFKGLALLCVAAIPCLVEIKNKKMHQFMIVLFSVCFVLGILQRMGEGVAGNAQLDTVIALAIIVAMGVSIFPQDWQGYRTPSMVLLTVLSISSPVIKSIARLNVNIHNIYKIPEEQNKWDSIYKLIKSDNRPSACRMLSICYWSEQPFTVDMFNLGQYLMLDGKNKILYDLVDNKKFGFIEYPLKNIKKIREKNKNYSQIF